MKNYSTSILLAAALVFFVSCHGGCDDDSDTDDDAAGSSPPDKDAESGNPDSDVPLISGEFVALSYNVAGLPEVISGLKPSINTPLISPLLNDYDLVLVQEDWLAPDPNPFEGAFDVYHDVLAADALHPYRSEPAEQPLQMDASRPQAVLSDGLNRFSNFPFGELVRVAWSDCFGGIDTSDGGAADCLAFKGFSVATHVFHPSVEVDVYNLHGEAGSTDRDQELSEADFEQLAIFINSESSGRAIILGGDTNLHGSDVHPDAHGEGDAQIWHEFKVATGLIDVCDVVSPCETSIDKFSLRSNETITIEPISYAFERNKFVNDKGEPLSDHEPLAVGFRWTLKE